MYVGSPHHNLAVKYIQSNSGQIMYILAHCKYISNFYIQPHNFFAPLYQMKQYWNAFAQNSKGFLYRPLGWWE